MSPPDQPVGLSLLQNVQDLHAADDTAEHDVLAILACTMSGECMIGG